MFKSMTADQRRLLLVLTLINLLNYLDRQVVFPLFGHLKIEFGLTDFHLGILATVFLLVQSIAAFPMGILADRYSRKFLIAVSIALWSCATFLSGLAQNFKQLLGFRALVGVGEAGYGPSSAAIITDNFPDNINSRVQGIFNVGMLVGGTLGAIVGGLIAYYFNNWRLAFFIVAIPGFVMALFAMRIKEKRVEHDEPKIHIKTLFKNPSYLWLLISGTFIAFASGGFITWGIEFISRYKGFNVRDASMILGFGMMAFSVIGVLVGSYVADRLHRSYAWGRSAVVAGSLIIAAPLMYIGLSDTGHVAFLVCFFLGAAFLSVYLGPVTAVLHDMVPKQFRASAFGLYVLIIHLVGEATGPAVVGIISDHYNLRVGLQFATICVLVSGILFLPVVFRNAKKDKVLV